MPAMDPTVLVESDSTSEIDEQTKTWETSHSAHEDPTHPESPVECGIGHRVQASRSVLALVIDNECVFAGLQGGDIVAWSLETYDLVLSVHAHQESVLDLYLSEDGDLLFSSGGDSVINVWSTRTFDRLYSIHTHHDVGDIFAVAYSSSLNTIYCGGQNTSIQWCGISQVDAATTQLSTAQLSKRTHRFFDSRGPDGSRAPRPEPGSDGVRPITEGGQVLTFKRDHHKLFSHHGYVYTMLLVRGLIESAPNEEVLLTGAGDGVVKLWRLEQDKANAVPSQMAKLQNGDPVLSIAVDGSFLYCGLAGGALNIWNLDSHQLVKRITRHTGDLWAVDIIHGVAVCGDSNGVVKKFNSRFEEVGSWAAHEGTMLASAAGQYKDRLIYATGGNDNTVGIWDVTEVSLSQGELPRINNDEMVNCLAKFVGFKTVSASPKFSGECNQGAAFLRRHCIYLGAKTKLLTTGEDTNPIVHARFNATSPNKVDKTILFYGHYDVVGADANRAKWKTEPFQLTSMDGFLYGRGVSDNKGPILAALYAAAELARQKALPCDVVFLIEGEEESGSQGFHETVRAHKAQIGPVDWILLANSYWLDDFNPCLTYGLRGVVHANLIVSSDHPDLHSGIDGSALLDEPLKDLTLLMSTLVGPRGRINIPGVQDPVLPLTEAEKQRYADIAQILLQRHPEIADREALINSLMHRWREPSLTIHSIEVPGNNKSTTTTISRKAKASLSVRLVPNQEADDIAAKLTIYAQEQYDLLGSQNDLTVEITGKSDPWLGDPDNEMFETLDEAITAAWTPDQQNQKHQYPPIQRNSQERATASKESSLAVKRKDSSDSLASHIDRIIMSTTTSSAGKKSSRQQSSLSRTVPTSSTLTNKSGAISSSDSTRETSPTTRTEAPINSTAEPVSGPSGVRPIYIREGGSIPTIRFLEKEFSAPAANLPCGQASDNAHLLNRQQEFFTNLLNNDLIHPSIPRHSLNTIADVATGTGLWLTSLPKYLRSIDNHNRSTRTLHGFDISADQFPSSTKTTDPGYEVQFLVHDIRDRFPESYRGRYDLVNVGHLIAALREEEYAVAVRNLFEILKPNGHLQWTESKASTIGTIQLPTLEVKSIPGVDELFDESMSRVGFSLSPAHTVQQFAMEMGFARVERYTYSISERADLRAQARDWHGTIWRTVVPRALVQVGRAGSMQEAREMAKQWMKEIEREYGVFWPTVDMQVVVARKGE
ncbi:Zn-dependent exopeptidase [Aspergillus steynii IBT 23096]|uniref:Zn-dependent exopeptidase n=1 Tax=Aspergillus steynii IBT 23096 TaxID=1392250 RepID=A0A2I2GRR2_9EURO|nr:Zn-dependent exopeptidase [Aspergillus steynii IBT 23096]PLB55571.1 Zn-dependent exopeptidase [Aspergillus steynii IBT 23096]